MQTIEVTAKKVDVAIREGLAKLNAKLDDVNVEILSQGGLFKKAKVRITLTTDAPEEPAKADKPRAGRPAPAAAAGKASPETDAADKRADGNRPDKDKRQKPAPAKKPASAAEKPVKAAEKPVKAAEKPIKAADKPVKAAPADKPRPEKRKEDAAAEITPDIVAAAETFLKETMRLMGVEAGVRSEVEGKKLKVELLTDDTAVIGYRGEALDALEYLASLVAGRGEERYVRLRLDCNNYRAKREESLVALAKRMADKCARTGKKVSLEPMSSAHRRVIHAALTADDRVVTKSEGKEPSRRVVILPKKKPQ